MKALLYKGPKQLQIVDLPKPVPGKSEVLLKIRACGICGSDVHGYLGLTGRRIAPMVMGHEFSGEIESLGDQTSGKFAVGDRVTVQPVNFCGTCPACKRGQTNICENKSFFGVMDVNGAFQEYLCVPEHLLYHLPKRISFEEGALIEALAVAWCGVNKAGSLTDKNVLIIGGGPIGQLVLMAVKNQKPRKIVLSDLSETRLQTGKKIGADAVIRPENGDFANQTEKLFCGEKADVSIEAVGIGPTVSEALTALKAQGTCIWIGNNVKKIDLDMQLVVTREIKILGSYIYSHEEFGKTIDFMDRAGIDFTPLISEVISIEEAPAFFAALTTETDRYMKVIVRFD